MIEKKLFELSSLEKDARRREIFTHTYAVVRTLYPGEQKKACSILFAKSAIILEKMIDYSINSKFVCPSQSKLSIDEHYRHLAIISIKKALDLLKRLNFHTPISGIKFYEWANTDPTFITEFETFLDPIIQRIDGEGLLTPIDYINHWEQNGVFTDLSSDIIIRTHSVLMYQFIEVKTQLDLSQVKCMTAGALLACIFHAKKESKRNELPSISEALNNNNNRGAIEAELKDIWKYHDHQRQLINIASDDPALLNWAYTFAEHYQKLEEIKKNQSCEKLSDKQEENREEDEERASFSPT